jgi:F0F1-type ATP synthase assembly protein I
LAGPTPPKHRSQRDIARFSAVGIELGITIGFFVWIGKSLDERWGTSPWLLLLGMFLGLFGGFYRLKLKFAAWNKSEKDESH